jgi:hypothetical protein
MNISMLVSIDMEMGLPYGPYGYEKSLQRYLWSKKRVIPERYMGVMDVYDEAQLHERLSELARVRLIVIQKDFLRLSERRDLCKEQQQYVTQNFLAIGTIPCMHQPFDPNVGMAKFIDTHYRRVAQIRDYMIMQRVN